MAKYYPVLTVLPVGQGACNLIEVYSFDDKKNQEDMKNDIINMEEHIKEELDKSEGEMEEEYDYPSLVYLAMVDCGGDSKDSDFIKHSLKYIKKKMELRCEPAKEYRYKLDMFLLTHQDADHWDKLKYLFEEMSEVNTGYKYFFVIDNNAKKKYLEFYCKDKHEIYSTPLDKNKKEIGDYFLNEINLGLKNFNEGDKKKIKGVICNLNKIYKDISKVKESYLKTTAIKDAIYYVYTGDHLKKTTNDIKTRVENYLDKENINLISIVDEIKKNNDCLILKNMKNNLDNDKNIIEKTNTFNITDYNKKLNCFQQIIHTLYIILNLDTSKGLEYKIDEFYYGGVEYNISAELTRQYLEQISNNKNENSPLEDTIIYLKDGENIIGQMKFINKVSIDYDVKTVINEQKLGVLENSTSAVTVWKFVNNNNTKYFMSGDSTVHTMYYLKNKQEKKLEDKQEFLESIMTAPHHGSGTSSKGKIEGKDDDYVILSQFFSTFCPKSLSISAGIGGKYNLPDQIFIDKYQSLNNGGASCDNHIIAYNPTSANPLKRKKGSNSGVKIISYPVYTTFIDKNGKKGCGYKFLSAEIKPYCLINDAFQTQQADVTQQEKTSTDIVLPNSKKMRPNDSNK